MQESAGGIPRSPVNLGSVVAVEPSAMSISNNGRDWLDIDTSFTPSRLVREEDMVRKPIARSYAYRLALIHEQKNDIPERYAHTTKGDGPMEDTYMKKESIGVANDDDPDERWMKAFTRYRKSGKREVEPWAAVLFDLKETSYPRTYDLIKLWPKLLTRAAEILGIPAFIIRRDRTNGEYVAQESGAEDELQLIPRPTDEKVAVRLLFLGRVLSFISGRHEIKEENRTLIEKRTIQIMEVLSLDPDMTGTREYREIQSRFNGDPRLAQITVKEQIRLPYNFRNAFRRTPMGCVVEEVAEEEA